MSKEKMKIKEIIVVEGKDDVSAVKAAVDAEVITTGGLGLGSKKLDLIKKASESRGVIILTDPDFPGKKIRNIVSENLSNVKHAYICRKDALKNGNVGVENASPEIIIQALKSARAVTFSEVNIFSQNDLLMNGLSGHPNSSKKRELLGDFLMIGHCSGKQLLKRLNAYGISRDDFDKALELTNEPSTKQ